jgi:primase-polymerase (primpol)-like protein
LFAPTRKVYPSFTGNPDRTDEAVAVALGVNPDSIPEELKEGRRHVGWVGVPRGNAKLDKKPVDPRTGELASTTNPQTWATFEEAFAGYEGGRFHGVSRVLTSDDGLVGIDLDHVFSGPPDWTRECQRIVEHLNSYSEVSPGGDGLRIFVYGKLPPEGRKKRGFECYDRARHLTLTGHRLEGTPTAVHRRQSELEALHRQVFGEPSSVATGVPTSAPGSSFEDSELITRIMGSRQAERFARLWGGDRGAYPSASEADLALAGILLFWTGGDAEQADRLFRQSGLMRQKWLRKDYRDRTLRKALDARSEFYLPRRRRKPKVYATHREVVRPGV